MSTSSRRYSEEEKLSLLRNYFQSGLSKTAFCKQHGISCVRLLNFWLSSYGITKEMLPLPLEPLNEEEMANRSKESYKQECADLRKELRALKKALEFSQLETLARDVMIDKAEEYFNVAIRKKSGAKQH